MAIDCDVLVVGGGPAGSSAARAAAINGANVIFIEKKERPGKIECGEAVASYLIPYLPIRIPKNLFVWKTNGMSFDTEDMYLERYGKLWEAYSIDRKNFDSWLSQQSVKAGARLITNAELLDIDHDDYLVKKVFIRSGKKNLDVKPKILIAADGVESTVLKSLGLYNPKRNGIAKIYSYEFENVDVINSNLEQIYLGEYIDGGYGYIFPKSKNRINLGVGSIFKQNLEKSFEEFCELPKVKKQLKNGTKIVEKSGKAPVIPYLDRYFYGNVLITGDAACQNFKPYAEGILPGVICGDVCGKTASKFLKEKLNLDVYEKKVERKIGDLFKESDKITKILYDLFIMKSKKKFLILFALASNLFSYEEIEKMKTYEYSTIKNLIDSKTKNIFSLQINERLQLSYLRFKRIIKN